MKLKKELIKREIAGDTILVPVGKTMYDSNGMFVMNELGAFIWDLLPNVDTEEEIVASILKEYDTDEETVKKDVSDFVNELKKMEIL